MTHSDVVKSAGPEAKYGQLKEKNNDKRNFPGTYHISCRHSFRPGRPLEISFERPNGILLTKPRHIWPEADGTYLNA